MAKCYFHQVGCSKCNHTWILKSDRPIHWSTHVIWLVAVKYEHRKFSNEAHEDK